MREVSVAYTVRQIDTDGRILAEKQVEAHDYNVALRQIGNVIEGAKRIEVYNQQGEKAGQIHVDYWRKKVRSTK